MPKNYSMPPTDLEGHILSRYTGELLVNTYYVIDIKFGRCNPAHRAIMATNPGPAGETARWCHLYSLGYENDVTSRMWDIKRLYWFNVVCEIPAMREEPEKPRSSSERMF